MRTTDPTDPTDPASLTRAIRSHHRCTQQALADLLGVHWTSVARWEGGTSVPPAVTLRLLHLLAERPEVVTVLRGLGYGSTKESE